MGTKTTPIVMEKHICCSVCDQVADWQYEPFSFRQTMFLCDRHKNDWSGGKFTPIIYKGD